MSLQLLSPSHGSVGDVLYMSETLKDLTLSVEDGINKWTFPVHKLLLASESPVFRQKLADEAVSVVKLDDVSPLTVQTLLRFIYAGKLDVESWNEAIDLLDAATTYEVNNLVQKCGKFLEDVLTLSNVCYVYEKASKYSLSTLQNKCLQLILDAGFIVLTSDAFEDLNKSCVLDIVGNWNLNIDSDLVVFKTLFRWARIECCRMGIPTTNENIQAQIEPFLQHVCIDDMSDADKSELPSYILSCVQPNHHNRKPFCIPDSLKVHSKSIDLEFSSLLSLLDIGESLTSIRFSVDAPIHLLGFCFTFFASMIPPDFVITLVKENTPRMIVFSQNLQTVGLTVEAQNVNRAIWFEKETMLKQPVLLKAREVYNLVLKDNGSADAQLGLMKSINDTVQTAKGYVNFTIYDRIWGIKKLILI